MTTLKDVRKLAKKLGAIVEDSKIGHVHECTVEAPAGHIWKADDIHQFVANAYIPWKPDYDDLLDRMAYGIEPCTDPECDWCHPEED